VILLDDDGHGLTFQMAETNDIAQAYLVVVVVVEMV